ncbi:MAG: 3-dehydroquinate synthase [Cytophagales bacterium]|nr:3-dehydroquinate synthase [Bernardetiaceae bacterium]MDW8206099.1 3-dehydroquinate synthase [Cytophagales bacterium]
MKQIKQQFSVTYQYATYFTENLFAVENPLLAKAIVAESPPAKCLFVIDSGVVEKWQHLPQAIADYASAYQHQFLLAATLIVPGGEQAKNSQQTLHNVLAAINNYGICRHSYVIAIGGGAVLDMAGYAAAIAHRGVRHIRIPTTVLAQNDSGVGVKNSFNAFGKKNFLGTFQPPVAVINDSRFLETLSDRDWLSGISEAIKVALIKDKDFFEQIERDAAALAQRNLTAMQALIYRCAALHMEHIATNGDPFERGSARPLDFGHWAAHKLESMSNYRLRHGEAVAIGIVIDCLYAFHAGYLSKADACRVINLIKNLNLPTSAPELFEKNADTGTYQVIAGINEFREHLGGTLTITLINAIGSSFEVHSINNTCMEKAIDWLQPSTN